MDIDGLRTTIATYLRVAIEMQDLNLNGNGSFVDYYEGKVDAFKMILAEINHNNEVAKLVNKENGLNYCPKCGRQLNYYDYCPTCGQKVKYEEIGKCNMCEEKANKDSGLCTQCEEDLKEELDDIEKGNMI